MPCSVTVQCLIMLVSSFVAREECKPSSPLSPGQTLGHWCQSTPPIARGTGHVVPGARPCALGTFSYLVSSRSYFRLSYPNRLL